jgi:hypothetical protein
MKTPTMNAARLGPALRNECEDDEVGLVHARADGWHMVLTRPGHVTPSGIVANEWALSGRRIDGVLPTEEQLLCLQGYAYALGAPNEPGDTEISDGSFYWFWKTPVLTLVKPS